MSLEGHPANAPAMNMAASNGFASTLDFITSSNNYTYILSINQPPVADALSVTV
jgi:hypothetical protein